MTIPVAPETQILVTARNQLAATDLKTVFNRPNMSIRHTRHRHVRKTEEGVSLRLADASVREEAGEMFTTSETAWAAAIDIIVDFELTAEPDAEDAAPTDDVDVTGWDHLLAAGRYCQRALINPDPAAPLRLLIDDVLPGDIDPDEESQPDKGRLVISVIVLYRTRYDDQLELLSPTGNA